MVAIVIVSSELKATAEVAVKQLAPQSEGESFTVALRPQSSPAAPQPTHWACLPIVSDAVAVQIREMVQLPTFAGHAWLDQCQPYEVDQFFLSVLTEMNLTYYEEPLAGV